MDRCRICFTTFLNLEILGDTPEKQFLVDLFTREEINEELDEYLICYECKFLLKKNCKFIEKALKAQRAYLILQRHQNANPTSWANLIKTELGLQQTLTYHKVDITLCLQEEENLEQIEVNVLDEKEIKYRDFLKGQTNVMETCTAFLQDTKSDFANNLNIEETNTTDLPDNNDYYEDGIQDNLDAGNETQINAEYYENDEQYANINDDEVVFLDEKHECIAISSDEDDAKPKKKKKKKNKRSKYSDDDDKVEYNRKKKIIKRPPRPKKVYYYYVTEDENSTLASNENQNVDCANDSVTKKRKSVKVKKYVEEEDVDEISKAEEPTKQIEEVEKVNTGKIKKKKKNEDDDDEFKIDSELADSESDEESYDSYDDNGKKLAKPPREYPRKCDHCDTIIEAAKVHYRHYIINHSHEMYPYPFKLTMTKKFVCQHCGARKRCYAELQEHEKLHFGKKEFLCPDCGKAFYNNKSLRNHKYNVHGERKHICDDCGKGFQSRSDLVRHIRNCSELEEHEKMHLGKKDVLCPDCGKAFHGKNSLRDHVYRTHQESKHICADCSKGFGSRSDLVRHIRTKYMLRAHEATHGERNVTCATCGKSFHNRIQLRKHTASVHGERKFVCDYCGKGFHCSTFLIQHIRIHTGEKPYKCHICGEKVTKSKKIKENNSTAPDSSEDDIPLKEIKKKTETQEKPYGTNSNASLTQEDFNILNLFEED
ncbi:hypothetical protein NE865_03447 [Phthorimaea operculella]|nr:hypothetical protein NE865_03447 [Phthorimaea operculella]